MIGTQSGSMDSGILESRRIGEEEPLFVPENIEAETAHLLSGSNLLVEIKQLSSSPSALGRDYDNCRKAVAEGPLAEHVASYNLDKAPFLSILEHMQQKQREKIVLEQEERAAKKCDGESAAVSSSSVSLRNKHFLFVAGGHGRLRAPFAFDREVPSYWMKRIVDPLKKLGIRFNVIVLDSCYSASWVNEFRHLLIPDSDAILLAHGSASIAAVSAAFLGVFQEHGEKLPVPLTAREIDGFFAPTLRHALVSLLPRSYFTQFFSNKVVHHDEMHETFEKLAYQYKNHATKIAAVIGGGEEEKQREKEDVHHDHVVSVVPKLCKAHAGLLRSEFESPPTSSPLYEWKKRKDEKEEVEKKEQQQQQDGSRASFEEKNAVEPAKEDEKAAPAGENKKEGKEEKKEPVFDYHEQKAALIKRIEALSDFLRGEFRDVVCAEAKICTDEKIEKDLVEKLVVIATTVERGIMVPDGQQQQQKGADDAAKTAGEAEKEAAEQQEKKQKKFLLDQHFHVQRVVNTATDIIWDSKLCPAAADVDETEDKNDEYEEKKKTISSSLSSSSSSSSSSATSVAPTLRSVLTTLEEAFPMTSMVCLTARGALYREDVVVSGAGQIVSFGTQVDGSARSMGYDHAKCDSRGGIEETFAIDSREFADMVVKLFCAAF